jgi:four helix bundle protein
VQGAGFACGSGFMVPFKVQGWFKVAKPTSIPAVPVRQFRDAAHPGSMFCSGIRAGALAAVCAGMAGVKRFEELDAWKLSAELRDRIEQEINRPSVAHDVKFRDQIRDSSRSAPSNLAEGFGAYRPREFARFVRIARRSLMETENHLLEGEKKKYFTKSATKALVILCHRALGATTNLLRYLESCDGQAPTDWNKPPDRSPSSEGKHKSEPNRSPNAEPNPERNPERNREA